MHAGKAVSSIIVVPLHAHEAGGVGAFLAVGEQVFASLTAEVAVLQEVHGRAGQAGGGVIAGDAGEGAECACASAVILEEIPVHAGGAVGGRASAGQTWVVALGAGLGDGEEILVIALDAVIGVIALDAAGQGAPGAASPRGIVPSQAGRTIGG